MDGYLNIQKEVMGNQGKVVVSTIQIYESHEFETMVYPLSNDNKIDCDEIECLKSYKKSEALKNHQDMIEKYSKLDF